MMKLVVLFVFMASSMAWPTRFRRQADQTPAPASTCSYADGAYSLTLAGDSGFCFGTVDLVARLEAINAKLAGIIAHHGKQHHDDHDDDDDDEKMQSDQTQPQGADNTHAAQPTQQPGNSAAQQQDNSAAQQTDNSAAQQTDNSAAQQQETPSQAPTTKPAVTTTTTQKPTQAPTVAEDKVPEATEEVVVNEARVEETTAVVETKPAAAAAGESVPMQNAAATPVESE